MNVTVTLTHDAQGFVQLVPTLLVIGVGLVLSRSFLEYLKFKYADHVFYGMGVLVVLLAAVDVWLMGAVVLLYFGLLTLIAFVKGIDSMSHEKSE